MLFVIAAFAVDLGMAYSKKRQLSTAADAAALSAAEYIGDHATGDCTTILPGTSVFEGAKNAAIDYLDQNAPPGYVLPTTGSDANGNDGFKVSCTPDNTGDPVVTVANQYTQRTAFAELAGIGSITTNRAATAIVGPAVDHYGILPLLACSDFVSPNVPVGSYVLIPFPKFGNGTKCGPANGNWFKLNLPGQGNNGQDAFGNNLHDGCNCTASTGNDVGSLPGNGGSNSANQNYTDLLNQLDKLVTLPVADDQPGKNGRTGYGVVGFIQGRLCYFGFGGNTSPVPPPSDCTNLPSPLTTIGSLTVDPTTDNFALLQVTLYTPSGTINSTCRFVNDPNAPLCSQTRAKALVK